MPFTPPHAIRQLTSAVLGRKPNWGGETVAPTPVLIAPTMKTRARSPRAVRFTGEPIVPWTPLATALSHLLRRAPRGFSRCTPPFHTGKAHQCLPALFRGNLTSTSGIQGQASRGHSPTVTLVSPWTHEVREGQCLALREKLHQNYRRPRGRPSPCVGQAAARGGQAPRYEPIRLAFHE